MRAEQINVEYFFRLLYELIYGPHSPLDYSVFHSILVQIWLWIVVIGYALSVAGLFIIIYTTVRLFDLRKREAAYYNTLLPTLETNGEVNQRWKHVQSLMELANQSEWREAIVEADIMLDDQLAKRGYTGEGVGDKLKNIEPSDLATLQDAWEAHKVRNQIAHEGSSFDLSESLARRTIAHYEAVFRELGAI